MNHIALRHPLLGLLFGALVVSGCSGSEPMPVQPDAEPVMPESDASVPSEDAGQVPEESCSIFDPRPEPVEYFIGPDGLAARLVDAIESATSSVDVAVYELDAAVIVTALSQAAGRGVLVRVVLDDRRGDNQSAITQLLSAGVSVVSASHDFPHYHPKFLIVDGSVAWVMSANLNQYSMQTERNHGVVLRGRQDVSDLRQVFEADYSDRPLRLECTRLVSSPGARIPLERLIDRAQSTLRVQHLSFSDDDMRTLLVDRAQNGIDVRVLLAHPGWIEGNQEAADFLRARGVQVRFQSDLENHAKLIVADQAHAFVGSVNLSWTSMERNREIGVVVQDASSVSGLAEVFDRDWDASAQ